MPIVRAYGKHYAFKAGKKMYRPRVQLAGARDADKLLKVVNIVVTKLAWLHFLDAITSSGDGASAAGGSDFGNEARNSNKKLAKITLPNGQVYLAGRRAVTMMRKLWGWMPRLQKQLGEVTGTGRQRRAALENEVQRWIEALQEKDDAEAV